MTQSAQDTVEPDITITRTFDAPRSRVFEAWTDPAQFARWFGTSATTVRDVAMDVRAGGAWKALMVLPDGATQIPWHGVYREVDAPAKLVLTLSDTGTDTGTGTGTDSGGDLFEVVTVDFVDAGTSTEMTFTQAGGHLPEAAYRAAEQGWRGFFDDLATGLTGA